MATSTIKKDIPINIVSPHLEVDTTTTPGVYNTISGNIFNGDTGFVFASGGRLINVIIEPYSGFIKVRSKKGSSSWSAFTTLYNANF